MSGYRILVTGSRDWSDHETVQFAIGQVVAEQMAATGDPWPAITVVHGGAAGTDTLAAIGAANYGLREEVHRADWSQGRSAGIRRNAEMVRLGADVCLVFALPCTRAGCYGKPAHDSHGTADCAARAAKAGIPVRRFKS